MKINEFLKLCLLSTQIEPALQFSGSATDFWTMHIGLTEAFFFSVLHFVFIQYSTIKTVFKECFPKFSSYGKHNAEKLLSVASRYGHTSGARS